MKFTTRTEYGLVCLAYMARNHSGRCVTLKDIAGREQFSPAYIEKILQKLKVAGIVSSHQGKDGGYLLAKKPSEITLKQIIEALEGRTFDIYCEPDIRQGIVCNHFGMCGVSPIWYKTKQMLDKFYDSVTLEALSDNDPEPRALVA